ncbi:MAG: hypothetical protein WB507_07585 [Solirubrobacterales bacterium]
MALTDDQRAMLRLLAQREQGYEDIAALMGLSIEEVRVRVREALEEVDESAKASEEAIPEPAAEAGKPPAPDSGSPAPADQGVAAPSPQRPAEKPEAEPPSAPRRPSPSPPPSAKRRPAISMPKDQRLLAAAVAGVVVVVLILVLALSGGGSSQSNSTTSAQTNPSNTTSTSNPKLTEAVLSPVNGGNASGHALFGRIKKTVVLQVEASGLEPSPAGESYTVWLYRSSRLRIPLAATKVGSSGRLTAQYPLPSEVIAYLASGAFDQIDISLTKNSTLAASLAVAKKQKSAPSYTGTDVLRGTITGPFVKK